MTGAETTGNRQLAARARALAKAAGIAAVALATSRTVDAARQTLTRARLDDDVRQAALAVLDDLTHQEDTCA